MGTKATLAERDMRYRKLREAMAREGMSAVIAAGHAAHFRRGHIRYFTDTHMWAGDALLLIPLEGEPTLAWVSYAGSGWPEEMWVNDVRKAPYPETRVVDAMKAQKLTKGKVGIAGLKKVMTIGAYRTLTGSLPDVQFVDADLMVDRIRMRKSPLELQQYR
ncbi:MAG: hypothetical protein GX605_08125, partial [Chloroflexi bacterium]|nr:hypothetical protein [Chloroflexota bacterium]